MAMNKAVKSILKALSEQELDVERDRRLAELKKLDPIRIFTEKLDVQIENDGYEIPIRVYFPTRNKMKEELVTNYSGKVLLFLHGGGWATESIETYERICGQLAQSTGELVLSVEYRKSPEHHFPIPLMDGYAVAKALYTGKLMPNILPEDITLIGDSAGGNMAAAISLMARDSGEFMPGQQILIYPALWNDYTENTPFESVRENGSDYLLTAPRIEAYLELYQSKPEDRLSPYFAPLLEDNLSGLPRTLILTAEYDPLRDEGEEFGRRLEAAGNEVAVYRIPNAFHGYFSLGLKHVHVLESLEKVNMFLEGGAGYEAGGTETEEEA
ncbi:MAG: alpha/beta hydrolase [Bacteroides sp.]|nr:alpha/beta hydrolase [Bacteroides sp.]MCM1548967.1 alpha/beta hydrolase [Clostridium sp.]